MSATAYYNKGTDQIPSIEIVIDPADHYKDVRVEKIQRSLGLIPEMFLATAKHPELIPLDLWDAMDMQYKHGGGLWNMTNDSYELESDGTLLYGQGTEEEDPPLRPLAKFIRISPNDGVREVLYQYPHAIIVIQTPDLPGSWRVSRMD